MPSSYTLRISDCTIPLQRSPRIAAVRKGKMPDCGLKTNHQWLLAAFFALLNSHQHRKRLGPPGVLSSDNRGKRFRDTHPHTISQNSPQKPARKTTIM